MRRAVVLLQADGAACVILLLKIEDIFNIRPPEPVDGLVIVPHHADILPPAGQQPGQQILQMVGVLILVNEDIPEFLLVIGPHLLVLLQQVDRMEDNIVKIQGVGLPQPAVVTGINLRHAGHPPIPCIPGILGELIRGLVFILRVADDRHHGPGIKLLFIQAQRLYDISDDPLAVVAVVDGEIAVEPRSQLLNIPAQDADTGAVEGCRPDVLGSGTAHSLQAFFQLTGGFICKGNCNDRPRCGRLYSAQTFCFQPVLRPWSIRKVLQKIQVRLCNPVGGKITVAAPSEIQKIVHTVDEDSRFAASGSRQQQQRSLCGQNRFPLHSVHPMIPAGNHCAAGGGVSGRKVLCHKFSPLITLAIFFHPYSNINFTPGQPFST